MIQFCRSFRLSCRQVQAQTAQYASSPLHNLILFCPPYFQRLLPPLQFRLQLYCYSVPEQKRFFHQGVLLHLQTISGSVLHSQKPDGHSAQPHEATPSVPASNLQFCLHNFLTSHQFSARFQTEFRPLFRSINVQQPQSAEKARR